MYTSVIAWLDITNQIKSNLSLCVYSYLVELRILTFLLSKLIVANAVDLMAHYAPKWHKMLYWLNGSKIKHKSNNNFQGKMIEDYFKICMLNDLTRISVGLGLIRRYINMFIINIIKSFCNRLWKIWMRKSLKKNSIHRINAKNFL